MKKLLALILCVVMVMSLAPAAFANDLSGTTGNGTADDYKRDKTPKYDSTINAKKAIDDLSKDMKAMYYAIAADETVFGAAKGIYDFTDSLAKELITADSLTVINPDGSKTKIYQDDLQSNVRKALNELISNEVENYMNDRFGSFTKSVNVETTTPGRWHLNPYTWQWEQEMVTTTETRTYIKPDKYMEVFAKALTNALSSSKAQKNIEAMVYGLAAINLQKDVNDRADDLYDDIRDWDHWTEFAGWGKLSNPDPDAREGGYAGAWMPTVDSILVPTAGGGVAADYDFALDALTTGHFN